MNLQIPEGKMYIYSPKGGQVMARSWGATGPDSVSCSMTFKQAASCVAESHLAYHYSALQSLIC